MSGVVRAVGKIAGVVATVAAFAGPAGVGIAKIASIVALASSVVSAVVARPPAARGSVNSVIIDPNAPSPYLMGRTYFAGVLRHDTGYGGKVGKVQNPYRAMALVYSVAGPVDALEAFHFDHAAVPFSGTAATGYYGGFLWRDYQLGATPESDALAPHWSGAPGWGASSKLSGKAAIMLSLLFDKDGLRYASGVPVQGAVWRGVRVYDPRLDSAYPGGSGACRAADESTWVYSANPGLHGLTYALGRWRSGKRLFGPGIPILGVDVAAFVAFANVCDANGWALGGVIFEPDSRKDNLKNILAAGGGEISWNGARLSVKFDAPRVSMATIRRDDLGSGPVRIVAMAGWASRLNGIVPKYRSEAHAWEYVDADPVVIADYVTADGEEKSQSIQWNLVQDGDQAAQLAAYRLLNGREMLIELPLKPQWRDYHPGQMLTIDLPEEALDAVDVVMLSKSIDAVTLEVSATFMTEAAAKHDFALGRTTAAPPVPTLVSGEVRDEAATTNLLASPEILTALDVRSTQTVIITGQVQTTDAITQALPAGASLDVSATIRVTGLTGTCTQTVQIESCEAGGSFAALGAGASETGGASDTIAPAASAVLTNGSGSTKTFQVRAVTSKSGAGTGTVDQSQSAVRA